MPEEASTWVGKKVVAKYHYPIENEGQTNEVQNRFHVYTVDRIDGERLRVRSGSVNGWIPTSQVLLYDQAIDFYTHEIAANPDKPAAWSERGIIWHARKQFDIAIVDYNEAIRLDPTNSRAYGFRGIVLALKNEHEKAIADLTASIYLEPTSAAAYTQRGYAWLVKAEYDKAIGDFNEALRLDPTDASSHGYRGAAWLAKEEFDKAFVDYDDGIRLAPASDFAYIFRGMAWATRTEPDKAIADFSEAIRLDPENAVSYSNRGSAWCQLQKYDKAIADFNEAVRLDPTDPDVYKRRGWTWEQKNDVTKALADYTVAIRLDLKDSLLVNQWTWLRSTLRDGRLRIREQAAGSGATNGRTTSPKLTRRMSWTLLTFLFRCWLAVSAPVLGLGFMLFLNLLFRLKFVFFAPLMFALVHFWTLSRWFRSGQWRPSLWLWRVSRRVVGFCTVTGVRVSLLFPLGLDGEIEIQEIIRWSEADLEDLSQQFGARLRRRLTVILFSSHRDVTDDFGRPIGGVALASATAVVLAADCPVRESLRHEMVHLFASHWNSNAPPLVEEGLAVWLQGTIPNEVDAADDVASFLPFDTDPSLMLDPRHFFEPNRMHVSYALAGGFTGFLIRRFGWDHYRRFYCETDHWKFRSVFQRQFGMSFEAAWQCFHEEHIAIASVPPQSAVAAEPASATRRKPTGQ